MQIQPLNSLKTVSKVVNLFSMVAMTVHCFGALSQVRAIGHCMIGQQRDLLWPDWLNWWVCPWVPAFEIQIFLTPWNPGTHGQVWDNTYASIWMKSNAAPSRVDPWWLSFLFVNGAHHKNPTALPPLCCIENKMFAWLSDEKWHQSSIAVSLIKQPMPAVRQSHA